MKSKFLNAIATIMASAKEVSDRTGFSESLRSIAERAVERRKLSMPPSPGTPLLCSLGHFVEHSGIYLGKGRVAEVAETSGVGLLREVSPTVFLNGADSVKSKVRTGKAIFAACDAETGDLLHDETIANNAQRFIREKHTLNYNIITNNCHLFTASCIIGKFLNSECEKDSRWIASATKAFSAIIDGNAKSIKSLDDTIKMYLNSGRPIAWIHILPSADFHYDVLEPKVSVTSPKSLERQ